jgi:hypothetical protein
MPDTLLASLASTLKPSILEVARSLGEPEQAISRGFELAVAAVFEELTGKTDDLEMLRQVIDLASNPPQPWVHGCEHRPTDQLKFCSHRGRQAIVINPLWKQRECPSRFDESRIGLGNRRCLDGTGGCSAIGADLPRNARSQ